MPAKIDMTGKKFHRLTVIQEAGRDNSGQVLWECRCDCGNTSIVRGRDLRSGGTKSCGCLDLEKAVERIKKETVNHSNISRIKSQKLSVLNTSGIKGVCPTKTGRWRAYIGHKGKQVYLGEYSQKGDAVRARKNGEKIYFGKVLEEQEEHLL
jgi:hypothetical protein